MRSWLAPEADKIKWDDSELFASRLSRTLPLQAAVNMSRANSLERKSQQSQSFDRSTLHDSEPQARTSHVEKEKGDTEASAIPPEVAYQRHAADDYPDGGLQAWLVVLGAASVTFSTFGYVNAWGEFQDYYEDIVLRNKSPSTIAWIGSVQYSLVFLPALIVGRLFDIGYFKGPLFAASTILVVCTFLVAECKEYWHFLLCQGFGVGISCGLIFGPTMGVIAHWFKKKRSTAMGVVAFGSSMGGTVFPIAFRNLNIAVGFKWTMRIIGFILIFTLGIANLTLKRRLPPVHVSGGLLNLKQFKSPAYSIYTAAGFIGFLGLYTVLTFINASAPSQGVSGDLSFYLVSIANAGSTVGRLASGIIADRVGAMTVMAPATLLAGALTFAWPFVSGKGGVVAIALLYGATSGAYVGLLAVPMMALGESADVGRRTGMYMTILAFGAVAGPPISGAIIDAHGYKAVGIYAGSVIMVAVVLLTTARWFVLRSWRGKV
ncbi:MFS general substrate transporter, partial [Gloeopeniophorella convolvens]